MPLPNLTKVPSLGDYFKGGKGSGNFGHSGRPGQQGGSGSEAVKGFIKQMADLSHNQGPADFEYKSKYEYLLKNGQSFKFKPLPDDIDPAPLGLCYMNAYHLVTANPELEYVEGMAMVHGIPIDHAWGVTKDGCVVDPTWDPRNFDSPLEDKTREYFGVKIPIREVERTIFKRGKYGVIHNPEMKFPLLKGKGATKPYIKGGVGSGNFDHAGRPGERGGSTSSSSSVGSGYETEVKGYRKSTEELYKVNGIWDPERVKTVHEPVLKSFTEGVTKTIGPRTVYMTGGGYGSGKSSLLKDPQVRFPKKGLAVHVDPDEAKKLIPEFQKFSATDPLTSTLVHEESSYLAKLGVKSAIKEGYDVTYDTSGDTSLKSISSKVLDFRQDGAAEVVIDYAFPGSVEEAVKRADERAANMVGMKRYIPHDLLRANHREVARTFIDTANSGIFDRQRLWSTVGKFGDPLSLIAEVNSGELKIHDEVLWNKFKKIGGR